MFAGFDTFLAADAGFGIGNYRMLVERQVNLVQNLLGTGCDAFPAGRALVRVELYMFRML